MFVATSICVGIAVFHVIGRLLPEPQPEPIRVRD